VNKFWNFSNSEDGGRVLRFDGIIAAESWWGDEITPGVFRAELFAGDGDITVWLNSPGGDCIAASQIYAMLMDYKGNITVKIDGIAASAASVIAMAGTQVLMAPTALMMVHNPMTFAIGDSDEMQKAIVYVFTHGSYKFSVGQNANEAQGTGRTAIPRTICSTRTTSSTQIRWHHSGVARKAALINFTLKQKTGGKPT